MRMLLLLTTVALLGGCEAEPAKPRVTRAQRMEAAEVLLAKPPAPRTYRYPDAELRVFQVPVADGLGFVELQHCMVWRDLEFRTSTISCGVPPEVATPAALTN